MTPPIAIVGAGPAGLLLGRLLELGNIDYVIFERDNSPKSVNDRAGSLDLHEGSGLSALQEAGLLDQFNAIGRYDTPLTVADSKGTVLFQAEGGNRPEIDRKDLRTLLLGSIPLHRVRWASKTHHVHKDDDGSMSVHFVDGSVESRFRLVVGADGAWSKVRSLITSAKPIFSGFHYLTTAIKTTNPFHPEAAKLIGKGLYMALGFGKQLIGQSLGDGSFFVGVGLDTLAEDWDPATALADPSVFRERLLREEFAGFAQEQRDLIEHSEGDIYDWPLLDMPVDVLSWETVPGVTVIGDAAHVTIPSGEGVNTAMYDSFQLAQQIVKYGLDDLDHAVAEYEKLMFPRALDHMRHADHSRLLWAPDAPKGFLEAVSSGDAP